MELESVASSPLLDLCVSAIHSVVTHSPCYFQLLSNSAAGNTSMVLVLVIFVFSLLSLSKVDSIVRFV